MEIDYNIISVIDILGLVQGIILGVLLVIINRKRDKPTLFLGFFIITYSLELLIAIIEDLNILAYYPELNLLPFSFSWLIVPLFYVYVQNISVFSKQYNNYKILIPGIIVFIIDAIVFFQSIENKLQIEESFWYNLLHFLGTLFSITVLIVLLKFLKKHIKEIKKQYASLEYRNLKWIRLYVYISLVYMIFYFGGLFFDTSYYFDLITSVVNIILLYWISIRGILQQNVKSLIPLSTNNDSKKEFKENINDNYTTEKVNKKSKDLFDKLTQCILSENIFIKPDLTIIDVADRMNEHPKRISEIINYNFNQNFNNYINNFRVEKAKKLLTSELSDNYSIEGIGNEVGFQSKSTFYDAFKKITGTTPLRYKKNNA